MNPDDVTHVTRNERRLPPELMLAIDLASSAALLYWATHPECIDELKEKAQLYWDKFRHQVSVWSARQSIRTLPETDDNE